MKRVKYFIRCSLLLFTISLLCGGCDLLLRVLQKEMVEERELLGDIYGHNPKVEEIQVFLKELGYDPGYIDGRLGYRTRRTVKVFQKDYKLEATGYVDKKTWEELNRLYEIDSVPEGVKVRQIQTALRNAGFDPGPIDGRMGPNTELAIMEFQKSKGLIQDGKVGSKTWKELKEFIKK